MGPVLSAVGRTLDPAPGRRVQGSLTVRGTVHHQVPDVLPGVRRILGIVPGGFGEDVPGMAAVYRLEHPVPGEEGAMGVLGGVSFAFTGAVVPHPFPPVPGVLDEAGHVVDLYV